jgi:hypothetical protein
MHPLQQSRKTNTIGLLVLLFATLDVAITVAKRGPNTASYHVQSVHMNAQVVPEARQRSTAACSWKGTAAATAAQSSP